MPTYELRAYLSVEAPHVFTAVVRAQAALDAVAPGAIVDWEADDPQVQRDVMGTCSLVDGDDVCRPVAALGRFSPCTRHATAVGFLRLTNDPTAPVD